VAKRGRGFGMKVLYHDIARRMEEEKVLELHYVSDLRVLLAEADFISIHVPLTPSTQHLIGEREFTVMKPTAVLVNTSRGGVVDQRALFDALSSGRIFSAGLDVTEVEPIPPDDPLLTLSNLVIAPHIASASFKTREKMALMAVENLLVGIRGELPPNCINPEALKNRKG
jgi:glyoxylate reductase